jgi:5-hydroxyisourate hydrolase
MGSLSTHVLDTASGRPAAGMRLELYRGGSDQALLSLAANAAGRSDAPLLEGESFLPGLYRLVFHVGEYYRAQGHRDAGRFLEEVPVIFVIGENEDSYHVPLLVSPWSYTTYRGS